MTWDIFNFSVKAKMTPLQMAKAECANFITAGGCIGCRAEDLIDSGQRKFNQPLKACILTEAGKRCGYFEEVILPLADCPSPTDSPGQQKSFREARMKYQSDMNLQIEEEPGNRHCGCGEVLESGFRLCHKCRDARRKATYRAAQERRRQNAIPVNS